MKSKGKTETRIVVECYNHDESHCVVVVRSRYIPSFSFFYIPTIPSIDFGDTIEMNFKKEEFYVHRGNSRLTFKITPQEFPKTLLWELITGHMGLNEEQQ